MITGSLEDPNTRAKTKCPESGHEFDIKLNILALC